jgi:hypothetical protein
LAFLLGAGFLLGAAAGGLAGYAIGAYSRPPYYWYPYAPVFSPIPWHSPAYAAYAPPYMATRPWTYGYGPAYGYGYPFW